MILLLLAACPTSPDAGTVTIDSAWTTPGTNPGELVVDAVLTWDGDFPVTSVTIAGRSATLTASADGATATLALGAEAVATLDGDGDGVGTVKVVARNDMGASAEDEISFAVDPTPDSPVDTLSIVATPDSTVWAGLAAPYLPADGSVPVKLEVTGDAWSDGASVSVASTGKTPDPATGTLAAAGGAPTFASVTTTEAASADAGDSGWLVVTATASGRSDTERLAVAGAPRFEATSPAALLPDAAAAVSVAFPVGTAGILSECRATLDRTADVSVTVLGGSALMTSGASVGWVPVSGSTSALEVSVPAGFDADAVLTLACRDPYGQVGELEVEFSE